MIASRARLTEPLKTTTGISIALHRFSSSGAAAPGMLMSEMMRFGTNRPSARIANALAQVGTTVVRTGTVL
jgi:hypothetical protein